MWKPSKDVGYNRMMQVVAVFVDCFPFIRCSHFVDPVWVVVQLVFGRGGYFLWLEKIITIRLIIATIKFTASGKNNSG